MGNMKTGKAKRVLVCLAGLAIMGWLARTAQAEVWNSGHHEINDGDSYVELDLANDATADMFGGYVHDLLMWDSTRLDMFDGTIYALRVRDYSIVNIYGGSITGLGIWPEENGVANLYAHDVVYHPTGGVTDGGEWIEGYYLDNDNTYFRFDIGEGDMSRINIVPEPTTILLLGLGGLFLRRK